MSRSTLLIGAFLSLGETFSSWQGHNLMVIVTNDADGAVLGSGFFSWQDQTPRV